MSRTRVTHLDKESPNGSPSTTTQSYSTCGRAVHYTSVTNDPEKVICWFCKQTTLYKAMTNLSVSFNTVSAFNVTGVVTTP